MHVVGVLRMSKRLFHNNVHCPDVVNVDRLNESPNWKCDKIHKHNSIFR